MEVRLWGNVTFTRLLQPLKASAPIWVISSGNVNSRRPVIWKAHAPMRLSLLKGRATSVNEVQQLKQSCQCW